PQRQLHPALILLESFQRAVNFGFALWRERLDEPQRTTEIDDRKRGIGQALSEAQSHRQRPLAEEMRWSLVTVSRRIPPTETNEVALQVGVWQLNDLPACQ